MICSHERSEPFYLLPSLYHFTVSSKQAEATKKAYCDAEMGKANDKKAGVAW